MEEVTRVARAVATAFGAVKMNYELLGNQIAHIHWHLIPRRGRRSRAAPAGVDGRRTSLDGSRRPSSRRVSPSSGRIWEPDRA